MFAFCKDGFTTANNSRWYSVVILITFPSSLHFSSNLHCSLSSFTRLETFSHRLLVLSCLNFGNNVIKYKLYVTFLFSFLKFCPHVGPWWSDVIYKYVCDLLLTLRLHNQKVVALEVCGVQSEQEGKLNSSCVLDATSYHGLPVR